MSFIPCQDKNCGMQIHEKAMAVHIELNHTRKANPTQVRESKTETKIKGPFHYHKGRRGRCSCDKP